jgi:dipeptidyl aminopeptidase/acylaminoacyl peptidase
MNTIKKITPYGSWKSPVTSDMIVSGTIRLEQIVIDGPDIYWIENRPKEGGRYVIVRHSPDTLSTDITPPHFNARTRVHEYGGGSFTVVEGTTYFSNFDDQRLYRQFSGDDPHPLTPALDYRFADIIIDNIRNNLICVREDHTHSKQEPTNTLVSIDLDANNECQVLVSGHDFYSSPRLSPSGSHLAWLTWNHPNMPWDGTQLWVGEIEKDGSIGHIDQIAGGVDESIFQPEWSPDGTLYFISDKNGWWNLYCLNNNKNNKNIKPVCQIEAEFGLPQWVFGQSTYSFASKNHIICTYTRQGTWYLASIDTVSGKLDVINTPYTSIGYLKAVPGYIVFIGGSPTAAPSVVRLDLDTHKMHEMRCSSEIVVGVDIDINYLSKPKPIEYPTEHGLTANAFFYPPKNPEFAAAPDEIPPLLVISHGGPTASTSDTFNLMIQYWTTRGIAVLDVNYGGSTGYGRQYRQRLDGQWGIVDVDDCVNGARYLIEQGKVDSERLAIRGGSAGGYTTLCALTFRNAFKAGASYYGVSDLEAMVKDTHKFESRYLDRLIDPFYEGNKLYSERSPINSIERLSCPVIFFQGLEDKIVPPNQTEMMVDGMRAKGLPVEYVLFEGEQHGFRRAENIKRALDCELDFYSKVFGFTLAGYDDHNL